MQVLAEITARRWAARRTLPPRYVDGQRECDAPFRDVHGRGYWYSLEEYPIGSEIESRCDASGGGALTPSEQPGRRGDRLICLRHTDPFRRPIWCRTAIQGRREVERHGNEIGDGPGAR